MPKVTISFTLDTKKNTRILQWLADVEKKKENRSEAIRVALDEYLGETPHAVTLGDLYAAVSALAGELAALSERGRALTGGVTLGDLHSAILALSRKVASGTIMALDTGDDLPGPEPEDLVRALDVLAHL